MATSVSPRASVPGTLEDAALNKPVSDVGRRWYRLIHTPTHMRICLCVDFSSAAENDEFEASDADASSGENDAADEGDEESEEMTADDEDDSENGDEIGSRNAVVSMCVGVGSFQDFAHTKRHAGKRIDGLAHFCEHMLFMGSRDFPSENAYDAYLSANGGHSNAFTDTEMTVYHFEVATHALNGALERFAAFCAFPTFLRDSVEREVCAITSEFELARTDDDSRLQQLQCSTSADAHPHRCFSWGNGESLLGVPEREGIDTLEELKAFHAAHYDPSRMHAVVRADGRVLLRATDGASEADGAAPSDAETDAQRALDALEAMVRRAFDRIPHRGGQECRAEPVVTCGLSPLPTIAAEHAALLATHARTHPSFPFIGLPADTWVGAQHATSAAQCSLLTCLPHVFVAPTVASMHKITLTWPIPPTKRHFRRRPEEIVSHIVGHEIRGSILALLKDLGLASQLTAGVGESGFDSNDICAAFTVGIELTEAGVQHWQQVADVVFTFIHQVLHGGAQLMDAAAWSVPGASSVPADFLRVHNAFGFTRSHPAFQAVLARVHEWGWIYDELRRLNELRYHFHDGGDVAEAVVDMSARMGHGCRDEDVLTAGKLLHDFDPAGVADIVACLIPFNVRIDVQTSSFHQLIESATLRAVEGAPILAAIHAGTIRTSTEPHFALPFISAVALPEVVAAWALPAENPRLFMPAANKFIPAHIDIEALRALQACPAAASVPPLPPKLFLSQHVCNPEATPARCVVHQLWYKHDEYFRVPRSVLHARVYFLGDAVPLTHVTSGALADRTTRVAVFADLVARMWLEEANEDIYQAHCAGVDVTIEALTHGLHIELTGFSERFPEILAGLQSAFRRCGAVAPLDDPSLHERFARVSADSCRGHRNALLQPTDAAHHHRQRVLRGAAQSSLESILALASKATLEDLRTQIARLCAATGDAPGVAVESCIVSDLPADVARRCHDTLWKTWCLPSAARAPLAKVLDATDFEKVLPLDSIVDLGSASQAAHDAGAEAAVVHGGDWAQVGALVVTSRGKAPKPRARSKKALRAVDPAAKARIDELAAWLSAMRRGPASVVRWTFSVAEDEPNSIVCNYFQAGADASLQGVAGDLSAPSLPALRLRVILELLEHMMSEPLFNTLRTKEQLGYYVAGHLTSDAGTLGMVVLVESASHTCAAVDESIERFLREFRNILVQSEEPLDAEDAADSGALGGDAPATLFEKHKHALMLLKQAVDASLEEEAEKHWDEVRRRRRQFQHTAPEVLYLRECSVAEVLAVFDTVFLDADTRRKLSIRVVGRASAVEPVPKVAAATSEGTTALDDDGDEDTDASTAPGSAAMPPSSKGGKKGRGGKRAQKARALLAAAHASAAGIAPGASEDVSRDAWLTRWQEKQAVLPSIADVYCKV